MAVTKGGMTRSTRWSIAVNVAVICGLGVLGAVLILAVVQALSYKFDLRADLTADARYTPSEASIGVLRSLDKDVQIRFAFGRDEEIIRRTLDLADRPDERIYWTHYRHLVQEIARRVETTLNEWTTLSRRVIVETADADQNPQRVQNWAFERQRKPGEMVNRIWFRSGDEERVVTFSRLVGVDWGMFPKDPRVPPAPPRLDGKWRVQSELLDALRGLAAGSKVELRLVEGKRSFVEPNDGGFASTAAFLKTQGFDASGWSLANGPPPGGVLMLAAPGARLEREELDALKAFDAAGGRTLIVADPLRQEDFVPLLETYGLKLAAAQVEDPVHGAMTEPKFLISSGLFAGGHEIVRGLSRRSTLRLGRCRPLVDLGARAPGAVREPILAASTEASTTTIAYDAATGLGEAVPGSKAPAAGAMLAAACERPSDRGAKSRLVVIGGTEFLDKDLIAAGVNLANRDFLLNTLNWLAERSVTGGAAEPDRPGSRVEVTAKLDSFLATLGVGLLPGLMFVIGLLVHLRRRN
jgi:hypothetical protein